MQEEFGGVELGIDSNSETVISVNLNSVSVSNSVDFGISVESVGGFSDIGDFTASGTFGLHFSHVGFIKDQNES